MNTSDTGTTFRHGEKGVATLTITVILLVVATLATMAAGRAGLIEQRVSGVDVRNKEVYSAAVGGLEYAVNLIERRARQAQAHPDPDDPDHLSFLDLWVDDNGNPSTAKGARLIVSSTHNNGLLPTQHPVAMAADSYVYEIVYTARESLAYDPSSTRPMVIEAAVTATGSGDSHVQKTVRVDVIMGFSNLFSWSGDDFSAPPIVIEGCITGSVTGNPGVFPGGGLAVGTTSGTQNGSTVDDCLPTGHLNECEAGHTGPNPQCPKVPNSSLGAAEPQSTLWNTIFGDISRDDLRNLAMQNPESILWVDSGYPYADSQPAWDGNHWHNDVGGDGNPKILFFDESMGCPKINGSPEIHGIVYFEDPDCEAHGWGGAEIHGTVAVSGDLQSLNANTTIIGTSLDFTGGAEDPRFSWTNRLHYSEIPGSWRDF